MSFPRRGEPGLVAAGLMHSQVAQHTGGTPGLLLCTPVKGHVCAVPLDCVPAAAEARSRCCGGVSCSDSCYSRCGSPSSGGHAQSPARHNSSRKAGRCRASGDEGCGVQSTADTQHTHGHTHGARQGMHCTLGLSSTPSPSLHVAHSRSGSREGLRWCGRSSLGWRAEVPPAAPRAGPGAALRTSWLCCCCC